MPDRQPRPGDRASRGRTLLGEDWASLDTDWGFDHGPATSGVRSPMEGCDLGSLSMRSVFFGLESAA